jgi:uncharacterized protein DUF4262
MSIGSALDADPEDLDAEERQFVDLIREFGWHDTRVFDGDPEFSYTTGFLLKDSPEFIVFSLKKDVAHDIFWDLFRSACAGVDRKMGVRDYDVLGNHPAYLFKVAERYHEDHLGWSRWFYGAKHISTLQVVWPDPMGKFPWEPGFDEDFRNSQPDLSETGWLNELAD